jgi:hypothetical protein
MKNKEWVFVLVSNSETDTLTGKVSESEYGEEYLHFESTEDDFMCELRQSSIVYFQELETEEEEATEEAPAEEEPVRENKYSNRSVNDIPAKKKKGLFGF